MSHKWILLILVWVLSSKMYQDIFPWSFIGCPNQKSIVILGTFSMAKIAMRHGMANSMLNQMPLIDKLVNYVWPPGTVQLCKTSLAASAPHDLWQPSQMEGIVEDTWISTQLPTHLLTQMHVLHSGPSRHSGPLLSRESKAALLLHRLVIATISQRHMVMPFIIKTQVALFHLFIQARLFPPSTFMLVQIDLTFEIVTTK